MGENDRTMRRSVHAHKADIPGQIKSLRASGARCVKRAGNIALLLSRDTLRGHKLAGKN
jgi:hypothetical protein